MSIADRITSMSNNLSNAYDGIEYLGVDTTGVDKNLQNLSSMLNVVYEGLPKVSDEGISPSIDGSRVGRLKSTLKASNTTQGSTTGYNILPVTATTRTLNGLTFTVNADNSLTINGTATSNMSFSIYNDENGINLNGDYVYYLIGKNNKINLQGDLNGSTVAFIPFSSTSEYVAKTYTNSVLTRVFSYISNGTTFNNETFKYMLIQGTDTTKPYEPYTGGIPSPNPNYPQDIHVVKGNNILYIYGKNILPTQEKEWEQGSIGVGNEGGVEKASTTRLRTKKYIPISQGAYYLSMTNSSYCFLNMHFYDENKTWLQGTYPLDGQTTKALESIPANAKFFRVVIRNSSGSTTILPSEITAIKAMVEKGTSQSTFETNNVVTLSLGNIELCKIGDYQDKLFKAISGDTVYDSLTSEQKEGLISGGWYKYGEINKIEYASSAGWAINNNCFQRETPTTTNIEGGFTNKYSFNPVHSQITSNLQNNQFGFNTSGALTLKDTRFTTLADFSTDLSSNPLILYYALVTPEITPITDTILISQLEAWYKAQSKNGQTNVLQTNADNPFIISASALKAS